jgi:hypothetical protein
MFFTIHNRTRQTVRLLGAGGPQPYANLMRRVGVQVQLASPPPTGDRFVSGLGPWSRSPSQAASIPPRRDAWVQFNFAMGDCSALRLGRTITINRLITVDYSANGRDGRQQVTVPSAQIILSKPNIPASTSSDASGR